MPFDVVDVMPRSLPWIDIQRHASIDVLVNNAGHGR